MFAVDLEERLAKQGFDVETVALAPGHDGGLGVPTLGPSSLHVTTLSSLRARARRAGVVVAHGSDSLGACAVATLGLRVPFVYRNIGDPDYWANNARRHLQVRLCLRRAASVVVMWPDAATTIARRFGLPRDAPACRVERGLRGTVSARGRTGARRIPAFARGPAGRAARRVCGRAEPRKRVGDAIDAVAGLPTAHLVVAGAGPQGDALLAQAERVAPGRTHFLGMVQDTGLVYRAADVVVLPSATEGIAATLIEAGLSGIPVVATDVGGTRQIVVPDETGFLVTPGDVDGLRRAIESALGSAHFGDAARAHCLTHFDLTVIANGWAELLGPMVG